MLIDTRDLAPGRHLQYDVCIIGAGAAGITIARALQASRASVCLLESGGFSFDRDTQALYDGVAVGPALSDTYLSTSRLRFFGGTTNHWAGLCRPLDPIDFAVRPWVPYSGWPITRDDLATYYEKAADVLQFRPFDPAWGEVRLAPDSLVPPGGALVGKSFRYSRPTRFGIVYRQELVEARTVDVLLHANAIRLEVNEAGTAVERVQIAVLGGRRLTVGARLFVLAAGGIENARLLLVSNDVHTSGLGNGSDCVGRFFMEHPERTSAYLAVTSPAALEDLQRLRGVRALLCLSDAALRDEQLLNANIQIGPAVPMVESEAGGFPLAIADALECIDRLDLDVDDPTEPEAATAPALTRCFVRAESAPRRESRVTLEDRETDALGMRRARLEFVMGDLEKRTFARTMEVVARELGARQAGRVLLRVDEGGEDLPARGPMWGGMGRGNHHMGTTRMSNTSADGVVDRDCRLHGVPNLYVAGSSVFPTVGMANPTFTITALALRIADDLVARLSGGR